MSFCLAERKHLEKAAHPGLSPVWSQQAPCGHIQTWNLENTSRFTVKMPTRGKEKNMRANVRNYFSKDLCQNREHYASEYIFKGKRLKYKHWVILIFNHRKVVNLACVKLQKENQPQIKMLNFFKYPDSQKKATSKISLESTPESQSLLKDLNLKHLACMSSCLTCTKKPSWRLKTYVICSLNENVSLQIIFLILQRIFLKLYVYISVTCQTYRFFQYRNCHFNFVFLHR